MRKRALKARGTSGIALIEAALWLPILVPILLGAGYLYHYIRSYQLVSLAASTAASVSSSAEAIDFSTGAQLFTQTEDITYRPRPYRDWESCRGLGAGAADCIEVEVGKIGKYHAMVWSGYDEGSSLPSNPIAHTLPFKLSEESVIPGYNHVQTLPFVGIPRACYEPFNETGAIILASRGIGIDFVDFCYLVKPMYWKSPHRADFDGDGREDLVFFRPRGTDNDWGKQEDHSGYLYKDQVDFIVFYSGGAYSQSAGYGYFNLSTRDPLATLMEPPDIPIVNDYDRDSISDYAVFSPTTGEYRIALSRSRYRTILTGNVGVTDDGSKGLVAITGSFQSEYRAQFAVFATGGNDSQRYTITLAPEVEFHEWTVEAFEAVSMTSSEGTAYIINETKPPITDPSFRMKPHRGLVSVPAFADYDDDGITEIGFLSWHGGNLVQHVAGKVPEPDDTAFSEEGLFETADSVADPMNWRINPFDTAFDAHRNLFVVDSVDSRIWKLPLGVGDSHDNLMSASVVMPSHAKLSARDARNPFNVEDVFPRENVFNIPRDNSYFENWNDTGAGNLHAENVSLKNPRKIVFGPDGAMYIADFGNSRILRVGDIDGESGAIGPTTKTRVILGSQLCAIEPNSCPTFYYNGGIGNTPWCYTGPNCAPPVTPTSGPIDPNAPSEPDDPLAPEYATDGGIYGNYQEPGVAYAGGIIDEEEGGGGKIIIPTNTPAPVNTATPVPSATPTPTPTSTATPTATTTPQPDPPFSGKYKFYPMGLAIVPDYNNPHRYHLAFSSGNNVFLITHGNPSGGPIGFGGAENEKIWRVAGRKDGMGPTLNHEIVNPTLSDTLVDNDGDSPFTKNNARGGNSGLSTAICPVTDIKFSASCIETSNRCLYIASSCSVKTTPYDTTSPTTSVLAESNISGVFRIDRAPAPFTGEQDFGSPNSPSPIENIIGSFRRMPCTEDELPNLCAGPRDDTAPGAYQRKIDLSTNGTAVSTDAVNIVDLELSNNTLLFVHQWNDGRATNPNEGTADERPYYENGPRRTDHQHIHEIYRYDLDNEDMGRLYAVTNPFSYGGGTIPVESAHWYSPYTKRDGSGTVVPYIPAHEAPIKNVPFPVGASVVASPESSFLLSATPYLANPESYENWLGSGAPHPYTVNPRQIGFIHRITLDQDQDFMLDKNDPDIDGDGIVLEQSDYCPEPFGENGLPGSRCRVAEKIGNPIMYFFKHTAARPSDLPNGELWLIGDGSGFAGRNYGEYFFFNSQSECGDSAGCTANNSAGATTRPEVWATLLNFGDDQDSWDTPRACTESETGDPFSPYANCKKSSNGPIAVPMPLHALVGGETAINPLAQNSYLGKGYTWDVAGTRTNMDAVAPDKSRVFLFPGILSSTHPKENGIKVTRRVPGSRPDKGADSAYTARSGVLCKDYAADLMNQLQGVEAGFGTINEANTFSLTLDDQSTGSNSAQAYLKNYIYSSISTDEDYTVSTINKDNDNLGYAANCAGAAPESFHGLSTPPRYPAVEGIVLGLDHDETEAKIAGNADHWPSHPLLPNTLPENARQFMLIDSDGDGVDNPSWLTSDALDAAGDTDIANRGLFTFISGGMKTNAGYQNFLKSAREPFTSAAAINALGITLPWGADGSPYRSAFYVYEQSSPPATGQINFGFDKYRTTGNRGNGLFVSLGFEPFITPIFKNDDFQDVGAGMYADYTLNNRFQFDGATGGMELLGESPAVVAAKNILKISLGEDIVFHDSLSNFESSEGEQNAYVALLSRANATIDEPILCNPLSAPTSTDACTDIGVYFKIRYLGHPITVRKRAPLNMAGLVNHAPICDPEDDAPTRTINGKPFDCGINTGGGTEGGGGQLQGSQPQE